MHSRKKLLISLTIAVIAMISVAAGIILSEKNKAISKKITTVSCDTKNVSSQNITETECHKSQVQSAGTQKNNPVDSTEIKKTKWSEYLTSHPFYNRPQMTKAEWKKIPKTDRPDLAFEFNFLKIVDPALGEVPEERLHIANKQMMAIFAQKAEIPGIDWVERGPDNIGGRTRALMFDPNDATNKKVWAGGVGGGLWYTNDITVAEPNWNKVGDFWSNIAISTIAYDPSNTNIFYVGTGEGWNNGGAQKSTGIWKTTDAGSTWSVLANTVPGAYNSASNFHYVQKIVVKNDGTVFAATRGYYINRGGIMRSTDGGSTWTQVLSIYDGTGTKYDRAADIEIAAGGDLYCSFGIGSQGKVFKSANSDNGASGTWTDLTPLMSPTGNEKRIELACAPSDANIIYAVANGPSGESDIDWFKKSVDGGASWSDITIPVMVEDGTTHFTRGQAGYDLILAVHPTNPDLVIAGGIDLHRTSDGGTVWESVSQWYGGFSLPEVHADQHAIIFRPGNSDEALFGNDGGIFLSTNIGNNAATPAFDIKNTGYNVTQFYSCAMANEVNRNYFLAGAQDNGTQQFELPQTNSTSPVSGGDGGFCYIDQINSDIQLSSYIYNNIYRSLDGGLSFTKDIAESTGLFINPGDYDSQRKILYSASNNDLIKRLSGVDGTLTNVDLGIPVGGAKVSAIKVSPYNDVLILGISNGRVYKYTNASQASPVLTRIDNGTTPVTTAGWVSSVDVGADDNHILVTYSNYGVISIWETTDGGVNWYSKEGNLPDMPVRWTIYNPQNRNQVLAATELGVWTTDNFQPGTANAPTWGPSNTGLANTRCDMLRYRDADGLVIVATHGRGLYSSDVFSTMTIADFAADKYFTCSGSIDVNFTDASLKPYGTWAWDINNDNATDYTTQNVSHTYSSDGLYSIKLSIDNGSTSVTKENLILVTSSQPTVCTGCAITSNSNLNNSFGIGISSFQLGNIKSGTSNNDGAYNDYSCSQWTSLELNTGYTVSVTTGTANSEGAKVYIDYNDNGTFEESEKIAEFASNKDGYRSATFTTPAGGVTMDKALRLRVVSKYAAVPTTACNTSTYGQAEDYTVYFKTKEISLPVELISFKSECKNNGVSLEWNTLSEKNNEFFSLERSSDGIKWDNIGNIAGSGNSSEELNYSFFDYNVNESPVYYRLRQTDYDGKNSCSDVIVEDCDCLKSNYSVFPNPNDGRFTITGLKGFEKLSLINSAGQKVYEDFATQEEQNIYLNIKPGNYYLIIDSGGKSEKIKVIINK